MLQVEGNNGGDILEITEVDDGIIHLRSGSCCVMDIDSEVPVEFITGIINKTMLEFNGDIEEIIDSFGWEKEFKNKLKDKVVSKI